MKLYLLLPILELFSVVLSATVSFPARLHDGPVVGEFFSVGNNLDGPKISPGPANKTSFDWWHFDVASANTKEYIAIVFFNAGPEGYKTGVKDTPTIVDFTGSFANGTEFHRLVEAQGGATISASEYGIVGAWHGSGCSFTGTSLARGRSVYTLAIASRTIGIKGIVTFQSRSPAHYACSPDLPSVNEEFSPGVGWANAIPDAIVDVDLRVGDTSFKFTDGIGYHDKNWGVKPFSMSTVSWYWGHAPLGPFSVVWFQVNSSERGTHTAGYVAMEGSILQASCVQDSLDITPKKVDEHGVVRHLSLRFKLDNGTAFVAEVTTQSVVLESSKFDRMIGTITGGIEGQASYEATTLFEATKLNTANISYNYLS
ncbi:hypothetical protein EJ08DRAFT_705445 [Tothia fuscella]|uniref:Hydroxyneurosporene synthase n=1 Tax=Tothia fuscella TaxID=1048955 RepID=A0A9P4NGP7_9PEZI|nr:hypothetical protein EJ08DRAFT_705445 [Tothia fuscella]